MIKMNTKNLKVMTLLAVLVMGVVFVSGCTQSSVGTPGGVSGLSAYPNSQETTQYNTWAAMTGFSGKYSELHQYVVSGVSPIDIIKWYKSKFSSYTVENEGNASIQGVNYALLTLRKGNKIIGVAAFEQGGKTIYFVGEATESEEEGESLPSHDMASGEEPLERYPGSIMLSYSKEGKFPIDYDIEYGTNDAYDKVSDWFKNTLQSQGWNIKSQSGSSDTIELSFEKDDDEVTIYIGAPGEGRAYTSIDVSYTKSTLPDHDLVNGTDPMERYPGSMMVDYSKSKWNFQGANGYEINVEYLTSDDFEQVKQWYLNKLNSMFGSGENSGVSESDNTIEASMYSNNIVKIVHVEFGEGKTYTDIYLDYAQTGE